tara:strand:+ start:12357 stop:12830 length:474 start_codon:yes stop_codon:yes gene_type:complete
VNDKDLNIVRSEDQFLFNAWKFYRHIDIPAKPEKDCWLWTGPLNGGPGNYGYIYLEGRKQMAHRFSVEIHTQKKIPEGKVISHLCNNPQCVNPYHLEIATQKQNVAHMIKSKRDNIGRKLTSKDVSEIRISDRPGVELAKKYKVAQSTISMIKTGKR